MPSACKSLKSTHQKITDQNVFESLSTNLMNVLKSALQYQQVYIYLFLLELFCCNCCHKRFFLYDIFLHYLPSTYSRLPVIRNSKENKNFSPKIETWNNWKSTLKWPISNYYQFFTELDCEKEVHLWNEMLRKSFPFKITKSLTFSEEIVYFRLFFCFLRLFVKSLRYEA